MRTAGKTHRRLRSGRRVKGEAPGLPRAPEPLSRGSHEAFRERLGALDRAVERAVAESGAELPSGSWTADAVELALERWARLARVLESGAVLDLWARPGSETASAADEFGYDPSFEAWLAPLLRVLHRAWWRVETVGLDAVPARGRVLLVANHAGGLFPYDAAMLKLSARDEHPSHRLVRPLLDPSLMRLPVIGDVLARSGYVAARARNAERLLEREQAVLWFPEGAEGSAKLYRDRYRLGTFGRASFVRAALRTGAPIVPVAIVGAEEANPVLGHWDRLGRWLGLRTLPLTPTFPWLGLLGTVPLPSKWRIEFGEPIDWRARYEPEAATDARLVRQLCAETRERVRALLAGALARRGRAFL